MATSGMSARNGGLDEGRALARERRPAWRRALAPAVLGIILGLSFALAATALGQVLGFVPMAYPLVGLDERLPGIFRLHMAASGLALFTISLAATLRHRPRLHRPVGRLAAGLVVIGAVTALPSALLSEASAGARAGLFVQGVVWLALVAAEVLAIRSRRRGLHAALMLMMASVASGAVVLRGMTFAIAAFDLPFEASYAFATWLAWAIPLAVTAAVLASRRRAASLRHVP